MFNSFFIYFNRDGNSKERDYDLVVLITIGGMIIGELPCGL